MESIKKTIEHRVEGFLDRNSVSRKSRLVVAWSGGTDSTAMLSILENLEDYDFDITAAWYDHGLRPQAEIVEEERFIDRQAEAFGVKLVKGSAGRGKIKEKAYKLSESIEEAARNSRYSFLYGVKKRVEAEYIVLAHNLDDNTETMMMRFLQNAGIGGLSGIPQIRDCIIRPLAATSRLEIEEYIKQEGLSFSIDKSNLEKDFLRNKLRLNVLPAVKTVFPNVDRNLSQLSEKFRIYNNFINQEAEKRIIWNEIGGSWGISQENFYSEPMLLRIISVFSILNRISIGTRIKYLAVQTAVGGSFPGNGKILLKTSSFEMITHNSHIFIQRLVNHSKNSYFIYLEPGLTEVFSGQTVSVFQAAEFEDNGQSSIYNNLIFLTAGQLLLRSYRDGDCIETEGGSKSIKKLFNEWKVDKNDRSRVPVIEKSGRIAAVIGRHLGYENRFSNRVIIDGEDKKILLVFNSDTETFGER